MTNTERNQVVGELFTKVLEAEQEMLSDQAQTAQLSLTANEVQILVDLLVIAEDDPSVLAPTETLITLTHEVVNTDITLIHEVVNTDITLIHEVVNTDITLIHEVVNTDITLTHDELF